MATEIKMLISNFKLLIIIGIFCGATAYAYEGILECMEPRAPTQSPSGCIQFQKEFSLNWAELLLKLRVLEILLAKEELAEFDAGKAPLPYIEMRFPLKNQQVARKMQAVRNASWGCPRLFAQGYADFLKGMLLSDKKGFLEKSKIEYKLHMTAGEHTAPFDVTCMVKQVCFQKQNEIFMEQSSLKETSKGMLLSQQMLIQKRLAQCMKMLAENAILVGNDCAEGSCFFCIANKPMFLKLVVFFNQPECIPSGLKLRKNNEKKKKYAAMDR